MSALLPFIVSAGTAGIFGKELPILKHLIVTTGCLRRLIILFRFGPRVVDHLRTKLEDQLYDFEIHLDIGSNGPTKNMIQEIVGMITGNGFIARIKPESYAATKWLIDMSSKFSEFNFN